MYTYGVYKPFQIYIQIYTLNEELDITIRYGGGDGRSRVVTHYNIVRSINNRCAFNMIGDTSLGFKFNTELQEFLKIR